MDEFEGYCVCDDGRPARDCGVSAHRREAFLALPEEVAREVRESDARMSEIEAGFGARVVWQGTAA
jgi:hypothetical protein